MINVEVEKNNNENNISLLRRFTRRVQGAGILPKIRSIRYQERKLSKYKIKMKALESIKRRKEREELIKMGKMPAKESR
ncbi:MAG: 30S ribosomal protein S21 [Patescibacteria group bacterium]|nr:30S ribosomal protein S21 [Patescibacteria group bacterium]MDE1988527.1 30S ribosomal protein S21 [Patescibacteria group bacterium]MDE2217865.1 30S ribosomal protein S21 [Patescibacteria group bacterium]